MPTKQGAMILLGPLLLIVVAVASGATDVSSSKTKTTRATIKTTSTSAAAVWDPNLVAAAGIRDAPFRRHRVGSNKPVRGGAALEKQKSTAAAATTTTSKAFIQPKLIVWTTVTVAVVALVYALLQQPPEWMKALLDKQRLQEMVVETLQGLRPKDVNSWSQCVQAYGKYAAGMTIWEYFGLSTIPVETAAGMVFGWPVAVASAGGKLLGASLAYATGRTVLQNWVHHRLRDNETCQLLAEHSRDRHAPFLSALLMKFSCFPETIKNFGTAAFLPTVTFPCFFLATLFHGSMFTLLWTWLGVETSQQIESTAAPTNSKGLQVALGLMMFMGFVLSPLSMAWCVQDLRKGATEKQQQQQAMQTKQN